MSSYTFWFIRVMLLSVIKDNSSESLRNETVQHLDHHVNANSSNSDEQLCTYRYFEPYPAYYFKLLTGWSCYNYAHPKWMQGGKILKPHQGIIHNRTQFRIPYTKVDNEIIIFDYESVKYTQFIRDLHVDEKYYNKWLDCAKSAMDCCRNHLNATNIISSEGLPCPAIWDGYTCYEKTVGDTYVQKLCPTYLTSSDKSICNLESSKYCSTDGWSPQTEYATCSSSFRYRHRHTFHVIALYIALAFMAPSIVIFFSYDQLKKWRIVLHRNLIVAIFVKNLLVVVSKNVIILNAINVQQEDSVMENDGTWCRVLAFFENLSKNLIFTCMTADAYHSHKTIARAFSTESNVRVWYLIITVATCVPTIIWSILMGVSDAGKCWVSDSSGYQWVTDGYKYVCLCINCILLADIMRVLFVNLIKRTGNHSGRAIKATIILSCLFGIPLLISSQRGLVNMNNCIDGDIYMYSTYSIEALQGVFMALFFCYLNQDVLKELKRSWKHARQQISEHRNCWRETIKRRATVLTTTNEVFL